MTYTTFLRLIMTYKKAEENTREWYEFGIDLHEGKYPIAPYLHKIVMAGFESSYDKEGLEWIEWFMFENEYGYKDWRDAPIMKENEDGNYETVEPDGYGAHDEEGNPIAYSYESLWELLEKDHKF